MALFLLQRPFLRALRLEKIAQVQRQRFQILVVATGVVELPEMRLSVPSVFELGAAIAESAQYLVLVGSVVREHVLSQSRVASVTAAAQRTDQHFVPLVHHEAAHVDLRIGEHGGFF